MCQCYDKNSCHWMEYFLLFTSSESPPPQYSVHNKLTLNDSVTCTCQFTFLFSNLSIHFFMWLTLNHNFVYNPSNIKPHAHTHKYTHTFSGIFRLIFKTLHNKFLVDFSDLICTYISTQISNPNSWHKKVAFHLSQVLGLELSRTSL